MKELVEALEEYVALLEAESAGNAGLLYIHGYRCPADKVGKGEELRAKIAALKSTHPRD